MYPVIAEVSPEQAGNQRPMQRIISAVPILRCGRHVRCGTEIREKRHKPHGMWAFFSRRGIRSGEHGCPEREAT
jgi:hypothetical protein